MGKLNKEGRVKNSGLLRTSVVIVNILIGISLIISKQSIKHKINYYEDLDKTFGTTYTIYKTLTSDFYEEIDEEEFFETINKEIVDSLEDEYTKYYTEEEYSEKYGTLVDNYMLGLNINYGINEDGYIEVISVDENSKAYKDGIRSGDIIKEINDEKELSKIKKELLSNEGHKLNIKIDRDDKEISLTTEVVKIELNSIYSEIIGDTGYIALKNFSKGSAKEVIGEFEEMQKNGINDFILDIRNNTGGILKEAINLSLYLTDNPTVTFTDGYERFGYSGKSIGESVNLELLINEYSASASETLIANVNEEYVTIGSKTYGKGVSQASIKLNGGYLVYTNSEMLVNGEKIHKIGIEPDINIDMGHSDIYTMTWDLDTDKILQFALEN